MSRKTLSPSFAAIQLAELMEEYTRFDAANDVTPATHRPDLIETWHRIEQAATALGYLNVGALLDGFAKVLTRLTGEKNTTQFAALDIRDEFHLYRNTAMTFVVVAGAMINADIAPALERSFPLKQRTQARERPLTDDEITLLRVIAVIKARKAVSSQAAAVYALCDAGQTPMETTSVTVADVDDRPDAPLVQAPGHRQGLAARLLPLEPFHTTVLADRISQAAARSPWATIAYAPRTNEPGSSAAAASATGVVTRFMTEAKVANADVNPASIRHWRIRYTWLTCGADAAVQLSGRSHNTTKRIAGVVPDAAGEQEPIEEFEAFDARPGTFAAA
jgi:hypothetical protein